MISEYNSNDNTQEAFPKKVECTSAEANKILHKLQEEIDLTRGLENESMYFNAASNEDIESVRPKYDYEETTEKLRDLNEKVRRIKHAINVFNSITVIPGFDMTIDEMLVYLPQMTARKQTLYGMSRHLPKDRVDLVDGVADYRISNFDVDKVKEDYIALSDRIRSAQTALDKVNSSTTFTIDFEAKEEKEPLHW